VPCVVDLAAMRDAIAKLGGDPKGQPAGSRPTWSSTTRCRSTRSAPATRSQQPKLEFERNGERYQFLRWGQKRLPQLPVVPPRTGIVHQVNLEYLARVVLTKEGRRDAEAYPDTCRRHRLAHDDDQRPRRARLGRRRHRGRGGDARPAGLMLIPQVVGFKLTGKLPEGATATDLVLTVTEMLRKTAWSASSSSSSARPRDLPLADRATIANMAPEYGATCGFFPVDAETLATCAVTGRSAGRSRWSRPMQGAGLWRDTSRRRRVHRHSSSTSARRASLAGPKRPQDRVRCAKRTTSGRPASPMAEDARKSRRALGSGRRRRERRACRRRPARTARGDRRDHQLHQHLEPVGDARRRPVAKKAARAASPASRG
jgi:aconitate hydratase